MGVVNIELYSLFVMIILILDYYFQFKNNFTQNSFLWMFVVLVTMLLSTFNILLVSLNGSGIVEYLILFLSYLVAIFPSLLLSIYIQKNFVVKNGILKKSFKVGILIFLFVYFILTIMSFIKLDTVIVGKQVIYMTSILEIHFLMFLTLIPLLFSMVCLFSSVNLKEHKTRRLVIVLALCVAGTIMDVISDKFTFLSIAYVISCLVIYLGKYDQLLNTDELTGLYNRRALNDFNVFVKYKKDSFWAVYFIDVDKFKLINDTFGHQYGDEVLKRVSEILKKSVRKTDIIIRYGGDEFVVVAEIDKRENSHMINKKIEKGIVRYNKDKEDGKKISLSIGYDVFDSTKTNFQNFIKSIDDEMYRKKEAKRLKKR